MSEVMILLKDPNEDLKLFNKRIREVCGQTMVTDFELHVVDGQPMLSLFSGMIEADEEDVAEAKEEGEELELGALIPEDDPVVVQVCGAAALVPMELDANGGLVKGKEGDAALTEKRVDVICERAGDAVTKVRVATGSSYNWVTVPGKDAGKKEWLPVTKTWIAVAHVADAAVAPAAPSGA